MWIDSHAHLGDDRVYEDIENVIQRSREAKIEKIINICTDVKTAQRGLEMAHRFPEVFNVASTTPHEAKTTSEQEFSFFAALAEKKKLVGIGETGLDYFYEHESKEKQKAFLCRYLELAKQYQLPVVIHCRDAFEDLFAIADEVYQNRPLLLHCFTGKEKEAKQALERGWKISISGIVTFKKSQALQQVVSYLPLDSLLIETDSPYLAPETKRGKVNEPSFIEEVAATIAFLKQISLNEVAEHTRRNAEIFFNL